MSDDFDQYSNGDLAFTRKGPYGTQIEPMYSGATSFLRRNYSKKLDGVDVAILGIPYDLATSNRPGARFGPRAVREASTNLAWASPWPWDFDPFDRLHVIDYGDCVFDPGYPHKVPDEIEACVKHIVDAGVTPLSIGGDHFVTYPVVKALSKKHGALALIHFDAHSDTWADEEGRIDHGTMFYHAAKQGIIDPSYSTQVGMRTVNKDTHGYQVLDGDWLHSNGVEACIKKIRERVGNHACYITFDVDFLDPSVAPGTGTPVCGGFSTYQAIQLIKGLSGLNVVGCDVVEVAPAYDHADITALAGATIATNMLCVLASEKPNKV